MTPQLSKITVRVFNEFPFCIFDLFALDHRLFSLSGHLVTVPLGRGKKSNLLLEPTETLTHMKSS